MSAEPTQSFEVDDVTLAWDRWGDGAGPAFVLCHGFSGSAHDFALNMDELSADRPVLAVDHRGHGRSTKLGSEAGYSIDRIVADLTALIDAEAGGPIDLLGHSMGGAIVLRLALARPDLIRSLILMDTSAWSFRIGDEVTTPLLDAFFTKFDPSRGLPNQDALRGPEDDLIAEKTPERWQDRKTELSAGFDPYAMAALGRELFVNGPAPIRDRLGELTIPTTVIAGEKDHPFVDQAEQLAAELPDSELFIIEGAYHSPQLTHPAEWTKAVTSHLARAAAT